MEEVENPEQAADASKEQSPRGGEGSGLALLEWSFTSPTVFLLPMFGNGLWGGAPVPRKKDIAPVSIHGMVSLRACLLRLVGQVIPLFLVALTQAQTS